MSFRREAAKGSPFAAANLIDYATFVVGAETANVINVGVQLCGPNDGAIAERGAILAYISDDIHGDSVTASAPTTTAVGTDGLAIALVAGKTFLVTSESNGHLDLNVTYAGGAATWYLILVMPDGSLVVSPAITFA